MRDIKCQAWDEDNQCMIDDWYKVCEDRKDRYIGKQKQTLATNIRWYTGLKDKNGKEIYEGDIVKYIERIRKKGTSFKDVIGKDWKKAYTKKFHNAKVLWDSKDGKYVIKGKDGVFYDCMGCKFSWHELEVIGNIYQNYELLKSDKK